MERRMAVLFLLALGLITWQALRTEPVLHPAYEFATEAGEQLAPMAVPSWRPAPVLPTEISKRLAYLQDHSVSWPGAEETPEPECRLFLRLSAHHWATRPAPPNDAGQPWRLLHLPAQAFVDDDDGDGDPLDAGELRETGPGAKAEVFCGGGQS
jgi:hypothetical protein